MRVTLLLLAVFAAATVAAAARGARSPCRASVTHIYTSCGCLWSSVELRAYFEAHASPAQLKMLTE